MSTGGIRKERLSDETSAPPDLTSSFPQVGTLAYPTSFGHGSQRAGTIYWVRCLYRKDFLRPAHSIMRTRVISAMLLSLLITGGCVRRDGRNADCKWPPENLIRSADSRHLSADAEFAEDLAIRYADSHYGLRSTNYVSGDAYATARDGCMEKLFKQIANEHGVSVALLSGSLGRNRAVIDLAVNLPTLLLYCFAVTGIARFLWHKYPYEEHGWIPAAPMAVFLSFVIAAAIMMFGDVWSGAVESLRIGNGHMSYRLQRLWWLRHRPELFTGAVIVFWLAVVATAVRSQSNTPAAANHAPH